MKRLSLATVMGFLLVGIFTADAVAADEFSDCQSCMRGSRRLKPSGRR